MSDTYIEQLVVVKRTAKDYLLYSLICVTAAVLAIALFYFSFKIPLLIFLAALVIYGAYILMGKFGTEYEYIYTNGDLDIDKISGKQSRKRIITADCSATEKAGALTDNILNAKYDLTVNCCSAEAEDKCYMIFRHKSAGRVLLIFTPNTELKSAINKSVPRHMAKDVFGE